MGAAAFLLGATGQSGDAIANGDTRSISIFHTHTREELTVVYKRDGQFDSSGLEKLNWALRDWRLDQPTRMDPRLFDIVWEVHRASGSQDPFNIVSAYRSPRTNAMLRQRSSGVAEHSQHMLGKAMDFYLPDVPLAKIREIGLRMQRGGVGYYPTSGSPFVHLDVGGVRHWPRMTRDQLARVFPDGKTVHIPADGRPMPGYDVALAEIQANGGTASAYASGPTLGKKSFFAALFGGGEDDNADSAPRVRGKAAPQQVAAYAPSSRDNDDSRTFFLSQRQALAPAEPVVRPAPRVAAPSSAPTPAPAEAAPAPPPQAPPVPLPLARPRDLPTPDAPTVIASAVPQAAWPSGPAAPAEVATSVGETPEPAGRVALVPIPTARPEDLGSPLAVAANVPLPPARPRLALLVASLPPPSQGASLSSAPSDASDHAADAPRPAARPQPAQAREGADADRSIRALFSPPASIAPQTTGAVGAISAAKAKPAPRDDVAPLTHAPTATIAMAFSHGGFDSPLSDHFTGPAVQPLKVTSFTPAR